MRERLRHVWAALALMGSVCVWGGSAEAADLDLFVETPEASRQAVSPNRASAPRDVAVMAGAVEALSRAAGRRLRIEIAPGVVVQAQRRAIDRQGAGQTAWSGDVADDDTGAVDLIVRGGKITGQVTHGGRTWRISPADGPGMHRITPVPDVHMPPDIVLTPPGADRSRLFDGGRPEEPLAKTTSVARILIGYTPAAKASVSDIVAEAGLAVSLANGAFRRSGADLRLKLAGVKLVKLDEATTDFAGVLSLATAGTGPFRALKKARNTTRSDFVAVLVANQQYCGIAWLGPLEPYAYSVTSTPCISYHTFAHEVGHNIGLRHDRYVEAPAPVSQFNYGYVNKKAKIRDIMSYANACSAVGITCTRVPMFSTPAKKYKTEKIGVAKGRPGAAHTVRTINNNRKVVAGFR
ncbi:MAG TPA: M12 family metallo-peptidase [Methylomirabilota bacterium]|nr:M12 family metallo-peptidase [Methylomirabilota bacterium]